MSQIPGKQEPEDAAGPYRDFSCSVVCIWGVIPDLTRGAFGVFIVSQMHQDGPGKGGPYHGSHGTWFEGPVKSGVIPKYTWR